MGEIWSELRRRNIFRVAVAYVVLGWVLLQAAGLVAPGLGLPAWTFPLIFLLLMIGFPVALLFAWAFELTPEGLKRTVDVDLEASVTTQTGRKVDFVIIGVLSVALLFFVVDRLFDQSASEPNAPQEVVRSSIAVLPFVNMSNDPDQVYFSDGISEEILNVLAKIPDLHVTSRSSAFQFRDKDIHIPTVAQQLGVANILEGSVRKSGKRIRITAQLIDAATDRHLWTNTYDRELTDIFAVQDEISKAIVDALHIHLGLEPTTVADVRETDMEAYRLYLLGRHSFEQRTKETLYKAIDLFDQVIAIDPDYAPAWSGKADAYLLLGGYGDLTMVASTAFAEPLIQRALELDPELAEAHASKGLFLQDVGRMDESLIAFDRALQLNPNLVRAWHWKAVLLESLGDYREETKTWQRAHSLDPMSMVIMNGLVWNKILFAEFGEAEDILNRMKTTLPDHYRTKAAAGVLESNRGNWSLGLGFARQAYEKSHFRWTETDWGISQLSLKDFDPRDPAFSTFTRTIVNSFDDEVQASEDYKSLPDDVRAIPWLIDVYVSAEAELGNYQNVIDLLEAQQDFTEAFPGPLYSGSFPRAINAPLLAWARRQAGDEPGANRMIVEIETYVRSLKEQGAIWTLPIVEAQLFALKGEGQKAVTALSQAHREGYLVWVELELPIFDSLRDREDFQAIVRSVDAKVNEERAKLGWEPVE